MAAGPASAPFNRGLGGVLGLDFASPDEGSPVQSDAEVSWGNGIWKRRDKM